jgi:PAS domain S-box-containing protein
MPESTPWSEPPAVLSFAKEAVMEKAEVQPRSSAHSIEVPSEIIGKWQEFVDLLAEIMHVPSASIMRADPPHIRVFVSSTSEGNPCEAGALDTGPYCETVMKTGQPLLVPDALENEAWKTNPHVRAGMISYLGVPIGWPDGRIFGTICVRDNKRNEYSEAYLKLLLHFRDMLQLDLKSLARLHGEIEERETKIRRLVDANIIGIFIWDFDGRILEANEAFLDIVGYDHEDLVAGRIRWTELTPPEWRDRDARLIQEHLKNGSLQPFEKEYFRKDGSRAPVLIGVATFEEGGNQGVAFVLDLTERKRAEEALRESEARFRDYAETASDWYWETDSDHKFKRVTDYERLLARGFAPVSRIGLARWEFATDVESEPEKWELHRSMLEARQPFRDFVYPAARTDGSPVYYKISGKPVFDAGGEFRGYRGTGSDVTAFTRAQEALRESQKSLQTIIDTIPALVVRYRADGTADFMNQTTREFVGPGVGLVEMKSAVHPDDIPQNLRDWSERVATGEPHENEMRLRRADGAYRWHRIRRVPLRDANGAIVNWYGSGHDIDDRKQAEERLRRSEEYLAEAQRLTHCGVTAYRGSTIFYGSEEIYRIWGFDPGQGVPSRKAVLQRIHPDDFDRLNAEVERALGEKRRYAIAYRIVLPDGTVKHLESVGQPVFSTNGELVEVVTTQIDVTERKLAEQALRESEARLAEAQRELQAMIDTIPAMVGSYDAKGSLTYANKTALDYTGVSVAEGMTDRRRMLVHPDDRDQARNQWRASVATGEPFQTELRLRRCDGEYRWVSTCRVPLRDSSGKVVRWYGVAIDIEDRKRAELALRERETQLVESRRELQETIDTIQIPVGRYSVDEVSGNTRRDFVNAAWKEYTGLTDEAALGSEWSIVIDPDQIAPIEKMWREALAKGEPLHTEERVRRFDGQYRWFAIDRVAVRDENGKVIRWYGTAYDIEDRKQAELALRRNETELIEAKRELQQTIDIIPLQVVRYSSDFKREFVNAAWKQFTGASDEAASGTKWVTTVHPDDLAIAEKGWRDALATEEPTCVEARLLRADGQYRWFVIYRVALRDENGKVIKWYSTGHDIEERKQAEDALRRSEAHLAEAQRLSHTGVVTYNGTVLLYASEESYRIWGFDPAQGIPSREAAFQRIHAGDRDRLNAEVRRAVNEKSRYSIGYRIVMPDGTVKHLETIAQPVFSASGKLVEIVATQTDVTDRKRAEDALVRSKAYLAEAQQLSCTGSFGWRISDNVIAWSQETYRIFELDPAVKPTLELVFERTHPDDIEPVRDMIGRMANEDRELDFEHRLLLPNGTIKHLHVRTHRGRFESGEVEVVGALMDITAAREAEEALRRAQAELAHASRVATLGELSASIAHEVNQPLAAIVASGEAAIRWLDREVPENERAQRAIVRLLNEALRASQVIHRIRELAKKAEPEMTQVDVNGLVEDVVTLVHREAVGQRVAVQTQPAPELPPVLGDRIQLQQVLINLVINGIQAMAPVTDRARVLAIRTQLRGDDEVLIAVEDAGVGIAPENLDRLFSAFYTTKPDGMGMGLSITRSILEAHGGRVWATPNSGPGMTFQFTLPAYGGAAALSPA